jgi:hypothetical protein
MYLTLYTVLYSATVPHLCLWYRTVPLRPWSTVPYLGKKVYYHPIIRCRYQTLLYGYHSTSVGDIFLQNLHTPGSTVPHFRKKVPPLAYGPLPNLILQYHFSFTVPQLCLRYRTYTTLVYGTIRYLGKKATSYCTGGTKPSYTGTTVPVPQLVTFFFKIFIHLSLWYHTFVKKVPSLFYGIISRLRYHTSRNIAILVKTVAGT